jgi:hypothetical protein
MLADRLLAIEATLGDISIPGLFFFLRVLLFCLLLTNYALLSLINGWHVHVSNTYLCLIV